MVQVLLEPLLEGRGPAAALRAALRRPAEAEAFRARARLAAPVAGRAARGRDRRLERAARELAVTCVLRPSSRAERRALMSSYLDGGGGRGGREGLSVVGGGERPKASARAETRAARASARRSRAHMR